MLHWERGKFSDFMANFTAESGPGPIIDFDTGKLIEAQHRGLANYTIGQNVAVSGAKSRLYLAEKDRKRNALLVVNDQSHPALWTKMIKIANAPGKLELDLHENLYCSIRSVDKIGTRVQSVSSDGEYQMIELEEQVYAPCPGQWAVFYSEDGKSSECGRVCLGGYPII